MTPQIALDLSHDGISMLSRAPDGRWWREGSVRLDTPDIGAALTALRDKAVERAGPDFATLLILPDDQLLFTSVERDDRDADATIRSSLKGRTPYELEDLFFDHEIRGDRLRVAVVARDTLAEAEAFAEKFAFRPVAFVGNPGDVPFDGTPFFTQTQNARSYMDGTRLEPALTRGFEIDPDGPPKEATPTFTHSGTGHDFAARRAEAPRNPSGGLGRIKSRLISFPVAPVEQDAATPAPEATGPETPAKPLPPARAPRMPGSAAAKTQARPPAKPPRMKAPAAAKGGMVVPKAQPATDGPAMALPGLARDEATQTTRNGRFGLALTLGLLGLFGGVGLWAALSPTDEVAPPATIATAPAPASETGAELARDVDLAQPEGATATREPVDPAALLPEAGSQRSLANADIQAPEAISAPTIGETVTETTTQAASDSAPESVPPAALAVIARPSALPTQAPGLRLAAINPVRIDRDLGAMPQMSPPAGGFAPQATPPAADTTSTLDEETELVPATPEGAVTPQGYRVVLGRPDVMPVPRPEQNGPEQSDAGDGPVDGQQPDGETADAQGADETSTDDAAAKDVAAALTEEEQAAQEILRRIRPIRRPTDVPEVAEDETPEAVADAQDDDADGSVGNEIADAAILAAQQAASASLAQRDEDLAEIAASSGRSDDTPGPVTGFALAQSPRPQARPAAAAQAAAARQSARTQQAAAAATAGTTTQAAAGPAPSIRSAGGSVSRAATDENVLRLNQMNLIGVYGRAEARRALVRLKNGRYVKVEVGDRLDRGRVTAIGEGELRYQRGGRNLVLAMPQA